MRELTGHKVNPANDKIKLVATDEPEFNANHVYRMEYSPDNNGYMQAQTLSFQKGPINKFGVNGITQEALIEICIDRLRSFQKSKFACRENAIALTKLEEAKLWLHSRTSSRMERKVEGTHEV